MGEDQSGAHHRWDPAQERAWEEVEISAKVEKSRARQAARRAALTAVRAQAERARGDARATEAANIRKELVDLHAVRHHLRVKAAALRELATEVDSAQEGLRADYAVQIAALKAIGTHPEAIQACEGHPGETLDTMATIAHLRQALSDAPAAAPAKDFLPPLDHLVESHEERVEREHAEAVEREDRANEAHAAQRRKLAAPLATDYRRAIAEAAAGDQGGWNRALGLLGRIGELDADLARTLAKGLGTAPDAVRQQLTAPLAPLATLGRQP